MRFIRVTTNYANAPNTSLIRFTTNYTNASNTGLYVLLRITLMPRIWAYTCYLSHVLARRGGFSLTERTEFTEPFGTRFELTERLRHTDITERYCQRRVLGDGC